MGKTVAIKSGIILVVLALVYSVFWFFKTGQVEKQISGFISENSSYISAGEVSVSGFPLSQKVVIKDLKFSIQNPVLSKYKVIIKTIEANSSIFSNNFVVVIRDQVTVQNSDDSVSGTVEFTKDPEIKASIADGLIAKFSYNDGGYRIVTADKKVLYAASSSSLSLETVIEEGDKIKTKISANFKDVEGFDLLSIYKNAAEKKVIDGIKTGEIFVNNSLSNSVANSVASSVVGDAATNPAQVSSGAAANSAANQPNVAPVANAAPAPAPAAPDVANKDKAVDAASASSAAAAQNVATPAPAVANGGVPASPTDVAANSNVQGDAKVVAAMSGNSLVKSNIVINAEYVLIPNQNEQKIPQIPTDPTQLQETPVQYSKIVKINSLEFSNPLYKVEVNGQLNSFLDDNLPSGSVTIKVTGIANLVSYFVGGFSQIVDQQKSGVAVSDIKPAGDVSTVVNNAPVSTPNESYLNFLNRVSSGLPSLVKEVAQKNAVSKDDVAVFDVRREKNLEFLINETSTREILGKF